MYDTEAVRFFDLAHEGAFIRSVRGLVDDGLGQEIIDLGPRSLIVIACDPLSEAAARVAISLLEPLPVAVVVAHELPRYAGALDVVAVVSSRSVAVQERDLHAADRRGCVTALLAPASGPLRDDAPERTYVVPAPPTTVEFSPSGVVALIFAMVAPLIKPVAAVSERLELAGTAVDEELLAVSPERDELVNEARKLTTFAAGSRIIHSGPAGVGEELAQFIATAWTMKGMPSSALELVELHAAQTKLNENATDIFHDPFEDGPGEVLPLSTVVWAQRDTALPRAIAQYAETDELTLENVLRLMVRGLAATVY